MIDKSKTKDFQSWKLAKLADPNIAASYLSAASAEGKEALRKALKNVAQAREMASVAKESGVRREHLYRAFSAEGNPTLDTLWSVLDVFGVELSFKPKVATVGTGPFSPRPGPSYLPVEGSPQQRVPKFAVKEIRDKNQMSLPMEQPSKSGMLLTMPSRFVIPMGEAQHQNIEFGGTDVRQEIARHRTAI